MEGGRDAATAAFERVREQIAAARKPRAQQGEVWEEIAAKSARHRATSPTGAMHDLFDGHRVELEWAASRIEMHRSQVGMLAAIGGRFVVMDYVSEVEASLRCRARSSRDMRSTRSSTTRKDDSLLPRSTMRASSSGCCSRRRPMPRLPASARR